MNERDSVRFGDASIDYEVRRSSRRVKTVQITVDSGGVQVAAPITTPASELRAIVRKRAPWILSHASDRMLEDAPKRFVSGETLPYLGRNIRMIVENADVRTAEVRFDHWRFWSRYHLDSVAMNATTRSTRSSYTDTARVLIRG